MKIRYPLTVIFLIGLIVAITNCSKEPSLVEQLGYTRDDILVIVNADDIGMHIGQTDGTLQTMDSGMCRSASIMVPCPDFERTAEICKNNPRYNLGIHLTLTSEWKKYRWSPVLKKEEVPSLYDPDGYMWSNPDYLLRHIDFNDAERELEAQIKKARKAGINLSHMNGHHSICRSHPDLFKIALKLSKKYNLPLRPMRRKRYNIPFHPFSIGQLKKRGYVFPNTSKGFYSIPGEEEKGISLRRKSYFDYMAKLKPGVHEISMHPAIVTDGLNEIINQPFVRSNDLIIWTSSETKEFAKNHNITFITFENLKELQLKKSN